MTSPKVVDQLKENLNWFQVGSCPVSNIQSFNVQETEVIKD